MNRPHKKPTDNEKIYINGEHVINDDIISFTNKGGEGLLVYANRLNTVVSDIIRISSMFKTSENSVITITDLMIAGITDREKDHDARLRDCVYYSSKALRNIALYKRESKEYKDMILDGTYTIFDAYENYIKVIRDTILSLNHTKVFSFNDIENAIKKINDEIIAFEILFTGKMLNSEAIDNIYKARNSANRNSFVMETLESSDYYIRSTFATLDELYNFVIDVQFRVLVSYKIKNTH